MRRSANSKFQVYTLRKTVRFGRGKTFSAFFFCLIWWKLIEDLYNCVQCVWCFAKHEVHLWPYSQYGLLSCNEPLRDFRCIAWSPSMVSSFLRFHWWLWSPWDWWRWADHCGTGKYLECLDKEVLNYYKTPHLNLGSFFLFPNEFKVLRNHEAITIASYHPTFHFSDF